MHYAVEPEISQFPYTELGFSWESDEEINKLEILKRLTNALAVAKPCTTRQRNIIERIIDVMPDAGKISAVTTIELLGKSLLWLNSDYTTPFAKTILKLQRQGITQNATETFCALERTLMACYCKILTKTFYGGGKISTDCLEWQRKFFLTIITTVETTPFIDPVITASTLKISGMITQMNSQLRDIDERIKDASNRLSACH